jgi:hypothetical protein
VTIVDNASGSPHTVSLAGSSVGFSITPTVSVLTPGLTQQFGVTGGSGGSLVWTVDGVVGGVRQRALSPQVGCTRRRAWRVCTQCLSPTWRRPRMPRSM